MEDRPNAPRIAPPNGAARVGYVVKRYPRYSETFIVNEILAHEAAGLEIDIFALRPPTDAHFQGAIARVRAPVQYVAPLGKAADFWREMSTISGKAGAVGDFAVFHGDYERLFALPDALEGVTVEDLRTVAAAVFDEDNMTVGTLVAPDEEEAE